MATFSYQSYYYNTGVITVIIDGTPYAVSKDHTNYNELYEAYMAEDADKFLDMFDDNKALEQYACAGTNITIEDGIVKYYGKALDKVICRNILEMKKEGHHIDHMVRFLDNLMQNPDANSIEQLYRFLEHKFLPITQDGCFIAYKTVGLDFFSKASGDLTLICGGENSNGQIYNGVGEVIECVRSEVVNDPNRHCSKGLHVGALDYAGPNGWYHSSSDRVVLVKVNPKDAVSVPRDHDFTKLRVCKYEVVDNFKGKINRTVTSRYDTELDDEESEEERECEECGGILLDHETGPMCNACEEEEFDWDDELEEDMDY